jgi:hypothetical protein
VNLSGFVALGVGLAREARLPAAAWVALGLVMGVGAAMATVHVLFVRPALTHAGDLHWAGHAASLHGTSVAAVIEKVASRDYTYVLLVCVVAGHIGWFLYAAALGSWAFVAGLVAYRAYVGSTGHRQATSR